MGIEKPERWEISIEGHKGADRSMEGDGQQPSPEGDQNQKSWSDAQEKAQEKARAAKDAYRQKMMNLVEAADLDGIMAELEPILNSPDEGFYSAMYWIQRGLQVAGKKDPAKLYSFLGARKAAFEGFLMLRAQIIAMNAIRKHDAQAGPPYYGELPAEVTEKWFQRLETIGHSLQETITTFARVDHAMKLGGSKRAGNKVGEEHGHERHSQRSKSSGNSHQGERAAEAPDHTPAPVADAGGAQADPGASGQPSRAA